MPATICTKCGVCYDAKGDDADDPNGLCNECWRRKRNADRRRANNEDQIDYGGVLGADGQIHSDADPGL